MTSFTESIVQEAALAVLGRLDRAILHGPEIAVGTAAAERADPGYRDVILERRLRAALARLNPALPASAIEGAFRKLTRVAGPTLIERNRAVHRMLVDGVTVEYRRPDAEGIDPGSRAVRAPAGRGRRAPAVRPAGLPGARAAPSSRPRAPRRRSSASATP